MKKHILIFLDYYIPHCWGVETVFEQIIKKLQARWYFIILVTSRFDKKLKKYEKSDTLEIYRAWSWRLSYLFTSFFVWFSLLKKKKIDIIHASTYIASFPASLLWYFFRKKTILTVHEVFWTLRMLYKWWFFGRLYLFIEKILFLLPYTTYHCVSVYTMNSLRLLYGISDSKLKLIYNWVDYDFWNIDLVKKDEIVFWKEQYSWKDRFIVLYYGHAGSSKWLDFLIDTIPQMVKLDQNVLFVLNIVQSKRQDQIINRLHFLKNFWFSDNIQIFEGVTKKDLRTMVASCDVVVAPSFSEWFWSVHTEVCSMKKNLITTHVASLPEVVSGSVVFVQPWSSKEILEALLKVKNSQQDIDILPAKIFDRNTTVDEIEKLYYL